MHCNYLIQISDSPTTATSSLSPDTSFSMSSTAGAVQGTSADDDNIQQEQEQEQADKAPLSNENENNTSNHNNASINKKIPPLSEEARALVKEEKEAIFFRPPPRKHFKNLTTLWGSVEHLDWDKMARYRENILDKSKLKKNQYPGLTQCYEVLDDATDDDKNKDDYASLVRRLVICPRCFKNPDAPLKISVLGCGKKEQNSSNISQHNRKFHQELVKKKDTQQLALEQQGQTLMTSFATPLSRQEAKIKFQTAVYRCVNDLGFPASTVEKPIFRDMLKMTMSMASKLSSKDINMSNKAVMELRIQSYNQLLKTVSMIGTKIRGEYLHLCGQSIPFSSICHDIWQGPKTDILGIVLVFTDPRNCHHYKIPIGLLQTKGHTASQVARHTEGLLNTVGFTKDDLLASVNDNTNSAVLAGKYIIGQDRAGKCEMHKAELIIKHATGLARRKKGGKVTDEFPEFVDVYKKFHKFASWLMSSKARSRFDDFRKYAQSINMVVIEIPLPNLTRVGGCVILFQALLRLRFVFELYVKHASCP